MPVSDNPEWKGDSETGVKGHVGRSAGMKGGREKRKESGGTTRALYMTPVMADVGYG
jgi:hypothetical protein